MLKTTIVSSNIVEEDLTLGQIHVSNDERSEWIVVIDGL
jgi:hypothetical protein